MWHVIRSELAEREAGPPEAAAVEPAAHSYASALWQLEPEPTTEFSDEVWDCGM